MKKNLKEVKTLNNESKVIRINVKQMLLLKDIIQKEINKLEYNNDTSSYIIKTELIKIIRKFK